MRRTGRKGCQFNDDNKNPRRNRAEGGNALDFDFGVDGCGRSFDRRQNCELPLRCSANSSAAAAAAVTRSFCGEEEGNLGLDKSVKWQCHIRNRR